MREKAKLTILNCIEGGRSEGEETKTKAGLFKLSILGFSHYPGSHIYHHRKFAKQTDGQEFWGR